ncbi:MULTISPECIES: hypothetical protein [Saccharothrix]|uniref:hypothetical protein n=1 Tax=Saccharothrix TaxID=2071 RepID=UPI00096785FE|nr:hypothetical protein [Saccharothrix sp. CB00851]OKI24904.1 hypothetical protein A6A25_33415 [Saccharothrix sp. CB00851]
MTTRLPIGRIARRAAVLGATLAVAVAAPLSASAHTADQPEVFICDEVDDSDLPTVTADGCEWTSPVILPDSFIIQPEYARWYYRCQNGHAAGTAVTGYYCERDV